MTERREAAREKPEAQPGSGEAQPGVRFSGITQRFPGVTALSEVSFDVQAGSCHAICGENGAGKSTLGRILAGLQTPDAGEIRLDGLPVRFSSPRDALAAGVAMVHQELAFCENLSVAENLCLGHYPRHFGVVLNRADMARRAENLLGTIGLKLNIWQNMRELSTAQEQLVQIAAAIGTDPRILVFDEPTSSLSEPEAQSLFTLIEKLKTHGITMIYVSHRMPELFRLKNTSH